MTTAMAQMNWVGTTVDVAPMTKVHLTWNDSQTELLRTIMTIYNEKQGFTLDPMYNKGSFYKYIPKPPLRFDIEPLSDDVRYGDARDLPLESGTIGSEILDPPFCIGRSSTGIMKGRYSMMDTMRHLSDLYTKIIQEAYRVIADKGILIFKCQDLVSSGRKHPIHIEYVYKPAIDAGFVYEDMLTLVNHHPLSQKHRGPQQHVRSATCCFYVFRKGRLSVPEKRRRAKEAAGQ